MTPEARDHDVANDPPAVKTPVEARAGLVSGHIVTILILGTILAIILLGIAWAIFGA